MKAARSTKPTKPSGFGNGKLLIGCGVIAAVLIGLSSFWMLKRSDETEAFSVSTIRPTETIRIAPSQEPKAKAASATQPAVQPPQGTMKRMEAIQGTFSKK